jgi:hypothetical protein
MLKVIWDSASLSQPDARSRMQDTPKDKQLVAQSEKSRSLDEAIGFDRNA